jgi:hypothetical protein
MGIWVCVGDGALKKGTELPVPLVCIKRKEKKLARLNSA